MRLQANLPLQEDTGQQEEWLNDQSDEEVDDPAFLCEDHDERSAKRACHGIQTFVVSPLPLRTSSDGKRRSPSLSAAAAATKVGLHLDYAI